MKALLFGLAVVAVASAGIGGPAKAQSYPWCAVYDVGDAAYNCGFVSFEQCMATVRGIGGMCVVNTTYQAPLSPRHPQHRPRNADRRS